MTTIEKIQKLREKHKISFLASELGLHRSNLFRKIKGISEFKESEINKVNELYKNLNK